MKTGLMIISLITTVLCLQYAQAELTSQDNRMVENDVNQTALTDLEQYAAEWGVTPDEWRRYQKLMQGQRGLYSPGVDPLTALGIEAQTEGERRYYAELQVKAEARRVEKELAYQRAYDAAWQRLYPTLLPVAELTNITASLSSPLEYSRLAVFVQTDCRRCEQVVQRLQASHQPFDIYMVNSQQDDVKVRRWAVQTGIDASKVKDNTITLNHDAGRWQTLGVSGELPALVKKVSGRWQRVE